MEAMLSLVDDGAIATPAAVDDSAELADEYSEAIGWARDQDTGLRLGFPGKDLWAAADVAPVRSVSLEALSDTDAPVWEVARLKVMWDTKIDES